mgnify:CR=1 FL=1
MASGHFRFRPLAKPIAVDIVLYLRPIHEPQRKERERQIQPFPIQHGLWSLLARLLSLGRLGASYQAPKAMCSLHPRPLPESARVQTGGGIYVQVHLTQHLTFKEHRMVGLTLPIDDLEGMMVLVAEFETQHPGKPLWPELQKAKDEWERRNSAGPGKPTTPTKES